MAKQTNSIADRRILADRNMAVADHLAANMYPTPTEIITFHCQQAAEKYLKGALVFLGEEPPYIHDLDRLRLQAEKHRPSFNAIASLCAASTISRYNLATTRA
jgi:HEPN domain-containing protein